MARAPQQRPHQLGHVQCAVGNRHPQWYYNLKAHAECELGGETFRAIEVTDPAEYQRLYGLAGRYYGGFSDYKAKTALVGRTIPVLRLTPVGQ